MARTARIERKTAETKITLELNLDGTGVSKAETGVGFLDHMLDLFARHAAFDVQVRCHGDLHVDQHHTVEDVGICLGQAIREAVATRPAIHRYGHFTLADGRDLGDRRTGSQRSILPGVRRLVSYRKNRRIR